MGETDSADQMWEAVRSCLRRSLPAFYEFEPGGALMLELGDEGWLLEVTPDARLICQMGMTIDDVMCLMSEGTPEDLGTDEVAKQAKYYLQAGTNKYRSVLRGAGFDETTEMTEEYVATMFHKVVDFSKPEEIELAILWCRRQFGGGADG